jgi:hypothetical protein
VLEKLYETTGNTNVTDLTEIGRSQAAGAEAKMQKPNRTAAQNTARTGNCFPARAARDALVAFRR